MGTVTDQARKTAETSRKLSVETTAQAATVIQSALREGALATVGAGDQVVRQMRALSERFADLDIRTNEGRKELEERLAHLRENAMQEFTDLVARGREVVDGLAQSRAAERASKQVKVASHQVKAAATSVRKIADVGAQQAFLGAARLRKGADETAKQAEEAVSQTQSAAMSVREAAERTTDVASEAAERVGTERTEVPLDELKFTELRELAKERDIEGRTGMNKAELIKALRQD